MQWRFIAADGVEMPLEEGTSAFITMNPGYIGRAELPESLKALFRPITVVVPDRQLIMENMLMAEGFETAKVCCRMLTMCTPCPTPHMWPRTFAACTITLLSICSLIKC